MRSRVALSLLVVAGCGDDSVSPPLAVAAFELSRQCIPTAAVAFPDTAMGQTAHAGAIGVRIATGSGDDAEARFDLAIDGPAAADFHVNDLESDCDENPGLLVGGTCFVHVEFAPTAVGPREAILHLGTSSFALSGNGVTAGSGLVVDVRNAAFVRGAYNLRSSYEILLTNQSAQPVTLGARSFSGTVFAAMSQCPPTLTAGAACRMTLSLQRNERGCVADTLMIASSANTVAIPMSFEFVGGVEVGISGPGSARVTSSPPGIHCVREGEGPPSGHCANAFPGAEVTLSVEPLDGAHFNGWNLRTCGVDEQCTVPTSILDLDGPRLSFISAQVASPDAKALDITFAGDGIGEVLDCRASCRRWLEPDTQAKLFARTPSTFGGHAGACMTSTQMCDLGVIVNDRAVTATFFKDSREEATLLPDVPVNAGVFAPGGGFGRGTRARFAPIHRRCGDVDDRVAGQPLRAGHRSGDPCERQRLCAGEQRQHLPRDRLRRFHGDRALAQ